MPERVAPLMAVSILMLAGVPPVGSADPPPAGTVTSGAPGILNTADGWHVEIAAGDETHLPVAPMITAASTREYLVGGTFRGTVTGSGSTRLTGGTLVAGYQIGCGVLADDIEIAPSVGLDIGLPIPDIDAELGVDGSIDLLPGQISVIDVADKEFEGAEARVTITGLRVNFDRCVGQSFIRSYATLAISTEDTEDVITYLGVTSYT